MDDRMPRRCWYHDPGSLRGADPGSALVYEVVPTKAFAFAKGEYGQTRWRFERD